MKILLPINEKNKNSGICVSFGRAPYFLLHDASAKTDTIIENTAAMSAGGAGIKAAQIVVNSKADALITPRIGVNAANVIKAANIAIYKSKTENVEKSIQALLDNDLDKLVDAHPGYHGNV